MNKMPSGYENWPTESQFRYINYCREIDNVRTEDLRQITKELVAYQINQELAFKAMLKTDGVIGRGL